MPPHEAVAYTAIGSRTAVISALHAAASVRSAHSCAVSVQSRRRPPMVIVWNSASLRMVMAVRWNTGFVFMCP